jgi:hypothetical protein
MSTFTIQYMSDLHIELLQRIPVVIPSAEYLALCGDIGNPYDMSYYRFLRQVSQKFKRVFVIAGNHEYYNNEVIDTNVKIQCVCRCFDNVTFLNNNSYMLEHEGKRIQILGTTLWSEVTPTAFYMINDSRKIRYEEAKLTRENVLDMHYTAVRFIKDNLESNIPTLLLTHHALSPVMNGQYLGNATQSGYSTNLESLFAAPLVGAISGHTHQSIKFTINGIPYVENAYGYTAEERSKFNPTQVLSVPI